MCERPITSKIYGFDIRQFRRTAFLVETEPDIRYVPNTVFLVRPWQQQQQQHGLYCVSSGLVYVLCGLSNVSDASRRSNHISQWPIAPSSLTDIHPTAVIIHKRSYIKYHSLHLRQPRTNLSISDIPCLMSGTSSMGSVDSPLSSSITPSLFHSRLKPSFSANPSHGSLPFLLHD